jgi:nicotinate-nucleotide adenylyltransferase
VEALQRLKLDEVWWLVSPQNPLKSKARSSFETRFSAARELADHPRIRVVDFENRAMTRYTSDTIDRLNRRYRARFVFLIGADNLQQLHRWYRWMALVRACPIAVFHRQPYSHAAISGCAAHVLERARLVERDAGRLAEAVPPAWVFIHMRPNPVSSTAIRAADG